MKRFTAGILASLMLFSAAACTKTYPAKTEDDIADFLSECGISVTGDCTKKTVTVPSEFGAVYEKYNELQKQQGFDLSRYRSREAEVYTYSVAAVDGEHTDYTEAHVMVCDGIVIAADLSSPALSGGMAGVVNRE